MCCNGSIVINSGAEVVPLISLHRITTVDDAVEVDHHWPHIEAVLSVQTAKPNSYIIITFSVSLKNKDISAFKNSASNLRKHVEVNCFG